jgi:hypothetical protein
MPLTSNGIFYADSNTPISISDITAAMATSVSENVSILQIVTSNQPTSVTNSSSTSFVSSNLLASITPKSRDSKILVLVNLKFSAVMNAAGAGAVFILMRDGSTISTSQKYLNNLVRTELFGGYVNTMSINYIDEPNTLSKITYNVSGKPPSTNFGSITMNNIRSTITLMEVE